MYKHNQYNLTHSTERGSILAITLMLLIILALLGTFAIRNATKSERVMNGIRTSSVSEHAAETALRFCERLAQEADESGSFANILAADYIAETNTTISKAEDGVWNKKDTWKSSNAGLPKLLKLPTGYYTGKHAPQCVIERLSVNNGRITGFVITARGFGDDAIINAATGEVTSGSETWLQSTLTQDNT